MTCLRIKLSPFSLRDTLECGQFFRYRRVSGTYHVQSSDRIFFLCQKGDFLYYDGVDQDFLAHFFRLDEDLELILTKIDQDPTIHQAIQRYRGMRLIRQDPWECLLSFLCSSAKRIDQIRSIIERLCRCSGERIASGNVISYGFPEPLRIRNLAELEEVRAGFRAPYLLAVNKCIDRDQLVQLRRMPYDRARQSLMELPGVGKKIADCVLLYSLDFLQAFPIDTWIRKGLQRVYRIREKAMEEFVSNHFGAYAGYAQLYLFHSWRQDPQLIQAP